MITLANSASRGTKSLPRQSLSRDQQLTHRLCHHPRKARVNDKETSELICTECGEVIGTVPQTTTLEKLNRQPENAIVHRSNRGAGSKRAGQKGAQPHHLHVLTEVYGNREGTKPPIDTITETCTNCKHQTPVKLFGETKHCPDCQSELGFYTFRRMPNGHGNATRFWADLRTLEAYDGPDDDPVLKIGREILSKKLLGHVTDEEAHWIAKKCLTGLSELSKVTRREVESIIDALLEGENIVCKSK